MAGQVVGTVVGEVRADTTRFLSDIESAFKRASSTKLNITAGFDDKAIKSALGDLLKGQTVKIDATLDGKKVNIELEAITKGRTAQVTAALDPGKATAELDDITKPRTSLIDAIAEVTGARADLAVLTQPTTVQITAALEAAKAKAEAAELSKAATKAIEVVLDAGRAAADISALTRTETKIIEVQADTGNAQAEIDDLQSSKAAASKQTPTPSISSKGAGLGTGIGIGRLAGGGAIAAGAIGLGLSLKDIISVGGNYQVALAKIAAQTDATKTQMEAVDKVTQALGRDQELGAVSAGDAAAAIQVLTKGQFSLSEATDAARAALQYSIVSQQGSQTAAEQLTVAMANLKIPVKDVQKVVDTLSASDLRGVTGTATDYAEALKVAGGAYATAFRDKAPIDRLYDINTALVTLDNQAGITGERAGSDIRRFLVDLQGPTLSGKKAIGELSVAFMHAGGDLNDAADLFHNSKGKLLEFPQIVDNITRATKGLDDQEKSNLIEPIFTTYGKEALNFLTQGRDQWTKTGLAVRQVGITQKLTAAQATGLKGATAALGGSLETLAIQSAKALSPTLVPAIDALSTGINAIPGLVKGAAGALSGLFDTIAGKGSGGKVKQDIAGFFGFIKTGISEFQAQAKGNQTISGGLRDQDPTRAGGGPPPPDTSSAISKTLDNLQTKHPIIKTLRDDFSDVSDAIGKTIDGISKVAGYIGTALKPAVDALGPAFNSFQGAAKAAFDFISDAIGRINFGRVLDSLKTAFAGVVQYITGQIQVIGGVFDLLRDIITGKWSKIWDDLKKIFSGLWNELVGTIKLAFGQLSGTFEILRAAVAEGASRAWKGIMDAYHAIQPKIIEEIGKLPGQITSGLSNLGGLLVDTGSKLLNGLVDGIKAGAPKVGAAVLAGIKAIPGLIGDVIGLQVKIGEDIISGIIRGIEAIGKSIGPKVVSIIKGIPGFVITAIGDFNNIGLKMIGLIIEGVVSVGKTIAPKVREIIAAVPGAVGNVLTFLKQKGNDLIEGLITEALSVGKTIGSKIKGLIQGIPGALGSGLGYLKSFGAQLVQGIINGVAGLVPALISKLAGIAKQAAAAANPLTYIKKGLSLIVHPTDLFKAEGGPVTAGGTYVVGERGPEIFVPAAAGKIFSNQDSKEIIKAATQKLYQFAGAFQRLPSFASGIKGSLTPGPTSSNVQNQAAVALDKLTDSTKDVTNAFIGATGGVVDFGDSIATAGTDAVTSIVDSISTPISDTLGDVITSAVDPIVNSQIDAASTIADVVDNVSTTTNDSLNVMGDTVQAIADNINTSSTDLGDALDTASKDVSTTVDDLGSSLDDSGNTVKDWANSLPDDTKKPIDDLNGQILDLQNQIKVLQTQLDTGGTKVDAFGNKVDDTGNFFKNSLTSSTKLVSDAFNAATDGTNRFTSDGIGPTTGAMNRFTSDAIGPTGSALLGAAGTARRFGDDLGPATEKTNFFKDTLHNAAVGIADSINGAVGTINAASAAIAAQVGAGAAAAAAAQAAATAAGASVDAALAAAAAAADAYQIPLPRALGGPAVARNPYLVGELGPELFFPNEDGRIVTARQTKDLLNAANISLTPGRASDGDLVTEIRALREQFADIADKVDRPPVIVQTPIPDAQIDYLIRKIKNELDKSYG